MLDENGFKRKTYSELLNDMEAKAKELYGEDVHISSHAVLGIFLRIIAWFLSLVYELAERVYNSGFVGTATGVQLDRLGSNNGVVREPAMPALVTLEFTGKSSYVIEEGVPFKTENDLVFEMIDIVTLDANGQGTGQAVSQEYASRTNVPAGAITVIVEPTEDLFTVLNPEAAAGGADRESDTDFRARIKLAVKSNPGPPINGIISALHEVSGVRSVSVVENTGLETDTSGNPPKSVHIYCFGGLKEELGEAIFGAVAGGIQTVGAEEVVVKDLAGFEHTVYFDYASSITIYASIDLIVDATFETSGISDVKNAVYNYINSLNMGETVVHSYIYPLLYQIPGIKVAIVKVGKSAVDVTSADIVIDKNEVAQTTMDKIEVVVRGG